MTEDQDVLGERLKQNAIRPALHFDALDLLHGPGIEHADLLAAAETVVRRRIDGDTMTTDVGDAADVIVLIEVKDVGVATTGHINAALIVIGIDIVNAASAHKLGGIQNLV